MYYAYIIQSLQTNSFYFGSTTNIEERLKEHNGSSCFTTRRSLPWKLVWFGAFTSEEKARNFEKYLKSGSGYAFSRKRLL